MSVSIAGAGGKPQGSCKGMVDIEYVAKLFSCTTRTVRRMVANQRIPSPVSLSPSRGRGGLVRWNLEALEAWIAAGCPDCRPEQAGEP